MPTIKQEDGDRSYYSSGSLAKTEKTTPTSRPSYKAVGSEEYGRSHQEVERKSWRSRLYGDSDIEKGTVLQ